MKELATRLTHYLFLLLVFVGASCHHKKKEDPQPVSTEYRVVAVVRKQAFWEHPPFPAEINGKLTVNGAFLRYEAYFLPGGFSDSSEIWYTRGTDDLTYTVVSDHMVVDSKTLQKGRTFTIGLEYTNIDQSQVQQGDFSNVLFRVKVDAYRVDDGSRLDLGELELKIPTTPGPAGAKITGTKTFTL